MNRLQKKCLISAAGFHLLLLLILFVGPAFLSSHDKVNDMPLLDFIPSKLVDAPFSGGGTPNAKPPPPAPPTPPAPQPQATPPDPTPPKTFLQKIFEPDPPKVEPIEKTDPEAFQLKKVSKPVSDKPTQKTTPDISLKRVKVKAKTPTTTTDTSEADARAEAKAQARAAAARQQAFSRSLQTLRNNLSTGTDVTVPGPGGAAYANYAQVVKSVYTQAWNAPDDVADDEATTKVKVVIARDGTVVSANIIGRSGSAPVDRSVQETLRRVQFVAPFPEGATDAERSFTINFNLKAKRSIG